MLRFDFWLFALLSILFLFGNETIILWSLFAIVVHECGHLLAIILFQAKICGFSFSLGTVSIRMEDQEQTLTQQLLIAGAGCLSNVLFALVALLLEHDEAVVINCAIALLNALPIFGLDGFDILHCFFTEKRCLRISWITLAFVAIVSVVLIRFGNYTLLFVVAVLCCKQKKHITVK